MSDALMNPRIYDGVIRILAALFGSSCLRFACCLSLKTGWVAPVNVATFQSELLPVAFGGGYRTPSAWAHKVEYEALCLCRPALGSQMRAFLHALKEVSRRASLDLTILCRFVEHLGMPLAWMVRGRLA